MVASADPYIKKRVPKGHPDGKPYQDYGDVIIVTASSPSRPKLHISSNFSNRGIRVKLEHDPRFTIDETEWYIRTEGEGNWNDEFSTSLTTTQMLLLFSQWMQLVGAVEGWIDDAKAE